MVGSLRQPAAVARAARARFPAPWVPARSMVFVLASGLSQVLDLSLFHEEGVKLATHGFCILFYSYESDSTLRPWPPKKTSVFLVVA